MSNCSDICLSKSIFRFSKESESNLTAKLQTTLREKDQLMEKMNKKVSELNSTVDGCRRTEEGLLLEKGKLEAEIRDYDQCLL
jgi:predicted nuclease with TOPRIM domain